MVLCSCGIKKDSGETLSEPEGTYETVQVTEPTTEEVTTKEETSQQTEAETETETETESETETFENIAQLPLSCRAAVIVNADNGNIIYSFNENAELPQASITKVMTAILVLENLDLDDEAEISGRAAYTESNKIDLEVGDVISVKNLLMAALIPSSNGAAVALAEKVSGTEDEFAELMNSKAEEIGCEHTCFANSHGIDEYNHYSSALDIARIMMYAMKNDQFMSIMNMYDYEFVTDKYGIYCYMKTTNDLIGYREGFLGGKGGHTDNAGQCFCGMYENENGRYVTVVLGCPTKWNRWEDTKELIRYIDEYY